MDEKFAIDFTDPGKKEQDGLLKKGDPGTGKQPSGSGNSRGTEGGPSGPEGRRNIPPKIDLPFTRRRKEVGEVVYDRRLPIIITAIVYLLLAIAMLSHRIIIERRETPTNLTIDIKSIEELARELEEAQRLNDILRGTASEPVRNLVSNTEAGVRDLRNYRQPAARTEEYLEQSREIDEMIAETRETYEQQLLTEEQPDPLQEAQDDPLEKSVKAEGPVSVSYTLTNPVREARNLFIPAYQCHGGGVVVVDVVVGRNGKVVDAQVAEELSANDRCMRATAEEAAYRSRFNVAQNAPARHEGRITYTFVPQNR